MQDGLVFNIQRYSVHDGPGIRTTVFLKGCPLRCAWCHNPEGIALRRELALVAGRCLGCRECRRACAFGQEVPGDGALPLAHAACTECGACVEACPTQARRWIGEWMTVDQVLQVLARDQPFYESSGGGVTFSGGEPLIQREFLLELLRACRHRGLHTAVDTCGLVSRNHLLEILPWADLFLYDLKLMDGAKHRRYTGADNQIILENLQALGQAQARIWVRVPVVPGVNDDAAELSAIARFAASIPGVRQANLLPFHATGLHKHHWLGQEPLLAGFQPPSTETMARAETLFRQAGLKVELGG